MEKIKEEFNVTINGKRVEVVKVDTNPTEGCLVLTRPDGTKIDLYLSNRSEKTPL